MRLGEQSVFVAGHNGMVGSAIVRRLREASPRQLITVERSQLDLRDRDPVMQFVEAHRPDVIVIAAARVGGIVANASHPVEFISDNLQIQVNLIDAAHRTAVPQLVFLGSSCIYPKFASQPIREDSLLTGPLEPTNDAYAIAKIAGVIHVQAMRREYGHRYISLMPTNLYGPGDNFDPVTSHVLPAMIRKFDDAKRAGAESVMLWGTGSPHREFLHVDDLADAVLLALDRYDDDMPLNVGCGADVSIKGLAEMVRSIVGYPGRIDWDTSKPDGTPRKLLDVTRLQALGWSPSIPLEAGIRRTYQWYLEHLAS